MHKWGKEIRDDAYKYEGNNPSFSSSLLDEIYRSICEGETSSTHDDLKFYRETMPKKPSRYNDGKTSGRGVGGGKEEQVMESIRRACLIRKWMEQKVGKGVISTKQQRKHSLTEVERKSLHDLDQDVLFFSSTSSSSDSSFGGFSSSDTESIYGAKSKGYSYAPTRPKPVRTNVSARSGKTDKTETSLFYEQRDLHMFDDYRYNSASDHTPRLVENIIKSKSRALKIYNNLKKVKQPLSPGGKLSNFINSLFTTGNTKKSKNSSACSSIAKFEEERKYKSAQASSTCSSASSFSRSCLSKNSPSTRERLRNGVKRSVRFHPVSVIVDEDSRPCGQKNLYEEPSTLMSVSLPTAWKIGKSPSKMVDDELKDRLMERSKRVEQVAREFLEDYHQNQNNYNNNDDVIMRDVLRNYNDRFEDDYEDEDDDDASCSSSDLFELDHLSVIGKDRYCQDLPVYETTHVSTNRAIANGLIM